MACIDKSVGLQVDFRHSSTDWCVLTGWKTSVPPTADPSTGKDRQMYREAGRRELGSFLPVQSFSGLVTLPQPEQSLSPCHSTLLGSIPVSVHAGRHLSTRVMHSRNKTEACTMWELAITANTPQPAQRNDVATGRGRKNEKNVMEDNLVVPWSKVRTESPLNCNKVPLSWCLHL